MVNAKHLYLVTVLNVFIDLIQSHSIQYDIKSFELDNDEIVSLLITKTKLKINEVDMNFKQYSGSSKAYPEYNLTLKVDLIRISLLV